MAFNDLTAKDIKTALAGIPHPATPRGSIIYGGREIFPAYQVLQTRFGGPTRSTASVLFLVTRSLADGLRLFLAATFLREMQLGEAHLIACDERGTAYRSRDLAARIAKLRDDGVRKLALVIGGADGLDPSVLDLAKERIAFGPQTWPHALSEKCPEFAYSDIVALPMMTAPAARISATWVASFVGRKSSKTRLPLVVGMSFVS